MTATRLVWSVSLAYPVRSMPLTKWKCSALTPPTPTSSSTNLPSIKSSSSFAAKLSAPPSPPPQLRPLPTASAPPSISGSGGANSVGIGPANNVGIGPTNSSLGPANGVGLGPANVGLGPANFLPNGPACSLPSGTASSMPNGVIGPTNTIPANIPNGGPPVSMVMVAQPGFSVVTSSSPTPSPAQIAPLPSPQPPGLTEYSLFNDTFTKVTQQSVWGREDEDKAGNKPGMNFASVAANNNAGGVPTSVVTSSMIDSTPPVDAAKAPGYRGANAVSSPVLCKMSNAASPSPSLYQQPRPTSMYIEDPCPLYQQVTFLPIYFIYQSY
ncbi:vegetative cell wall protein gp1-like [Diaphorina citri]|uniref:Vegetative cell wall protein gp1-like n=1 Tax=Diaphorina citri TaxID=121845 RepID=A0A3Q0JFG0_DIACI|nr:vegetative cell wall protein gp1-like [Diaphorina citri]